MAHPNLSIREQCHLLGINRSSIYYKSGASINKTKYDKLQLLNLIDETYTQHPFMGTRMMADYLQLKGHDDVKRHNTRWAYENLGLRACVPGPHTSEPHPEHKIYPYSLRDFNITKPNQVWSTDLTYIRLNKGFVYLMAIIDWYSRYVLDWELSITMEADFCIDTLKRTLSIGVCDIFNTGKQSIFETLVEKFVCDCFGEFSQLSQDLCKSDYDSSTSRDDRLNSPKSGMWIFRFVM